MKKLILILILIFGLAVDGFSQSAYNPTGDEASTFTPLNSADFSSTNFGTLDETQTYTGTKNFDIIGVPYGSNLTTLRNNCTTPSTHAKIFLYADPNRTSPVWHCCDGTTSSKPCFAGQEIEISYLLQDAVAADDDVFIPGASHAWTVEFVSARYYGCTIVTAPTITVADSAGNAMTLGATLTAIAHDAAMDCSTDTGCVDVTAGGALTADEGLEISVSNAIDPSGECEVYFKARGTMD